jgi:hypothetical protein
MACLAYNPSDITIDGKALKRDKLLEMCSMAISNARKELLEMSTMTYEKQNEAK